MSCNFRDFFRYNQINAGIMEYGGRVKIKFSNEIIRPKIEKSKEINRLIFKFSKEIMDFTYIKKGIQADIKSKISHYKVVKVLTYSINNSVVYKNITCIYINTSCVFINTSYIYRLCKDKTCFM